MKKPLRIRQAVLPALAILLALATASVPAYAQGAIFTTNAGCSQVNGNIYATKADVYLSGGPPLATLPDGAYYVKVTEPNGTLLGTSVGSIGNPTPFVVVNGSGNCIQLSASVLTPGGNPGFDTTSNPGCEYKVWVSLNSAFPDSASKTDNFKTCEGVTPPQGSISGIKFYDVNLNGQLDFGTDVPIGGWQVNGTGTGILPDKTCTNTSGVYYFLAGNGEYTITEVLPPPGLVPGSTWVNTTAISGSVTVNGAAAQGPNFGNVCLGAGRGLTLGFWSNKNGASVLNKCSGWQSTLAPLNLVDGLGRAFDPSTPAQLSGWLLNANATNMAYMLSVQLATMALNVRCSAYLDSFGGGVSGSAMIYTGAAPSVCPDIPVSNGFIGIGALMTSANTELGQDPVTNTAGVPRTCQEFKKTALDNANNNRNFVQPGPGSCSIPACPYAP